MNRLLKYPFAPQVLIILLASLVLMPLIGNMPLFDWDEINFAECAREMLMSGNYSEVQLYFQPFWEKPPLFIWLQAACMNVFGVNEFAARLPNVVCGIITLVIIFNIGKRHFSEQTGLLWVLLYLGCLLPHLFFKSGIIDPWFNLFLFLSVYFFILFSANKTFKENWKYAVLSGLFMGLGVLTKGPTAILIVGLVASSYLIFKKQFGLLFTKSFLLLVLTALLVGCSWFLYEIANGKMSVVKEFITYQIRLFSTEDSDHGGSYLYHFFILLVGCFPASVIFLSHYLNRQLLSPFQLHFRFFILTLFWVVLILFSIVQTKIVHYSSLCYLPLTGIAAIGLSQQFSVFKIDTWNKVIFWILTILTSLVFIIAGLFPLFKDFFINPDITPDLFTRQNLKAQLPWYGVEWILGVLFLIGSILVYKGIIQQRIQRVIYGLVTLIISISLCINIFIPRGELVSQQAVIDFYKQCAKHDCYVESVRFKSYAPLFYANRMPPHFQHPNFLLFLKDVQKTYIDKDESPIKHFSMIYTRWLLEFDLDKPAYFVCKIQNEKELFTNLKMRKLYSKNGFSFFVKMPEKKK